MPIRTFHVDLTDPYGQESGRNREFRPTTGARDVSRQSRLVPRSSNELTLVPATSATAHDAVEGRESHPTRQSAVHR